MWRPINGQNEAGNGWVSSAQPIANQRAVQAAEKMGLAMTGGSDAHQPERIGTCYTEFAGKVRTTLDLVAALKSKDHTARVNQEMVDHQRRSVKEYPVVSNYTSPRWTDKEDPWWTQSWKTPAPGMDRSSKSSYGRKRSYEANTSPREPGSDDDVIDTEFWDDPETIQRELFRATRARRDKSGK